MLRLASESSPDWAPRVIAAMDELLLDHAHCERKAAGTAVNLMYRYPDHAALVVPLSELAREELEHFELVVALIRERGGEFKGMRASPYAGQLMSAIRRREPDQMLDTLLCSALIEARSCERMKLLAEDERLEDDKLRKLYAGLLASEARHHSLYLELCMTYYPEERVRARLAELAAHEAQVIAAAPPWVRMHC